MSRLIWIQTFCHAVIDFSLKPLYTVMDLSKFRDRRVNFQKLESERLRSSYMWKWNLFQNSVSVSGFRNKWIKWNIDDIFESPGPSCSKLTMSLVNDSLKFRSSGTQICQNFLLKNVSSFCSAKATHIFLAKNIGILYIESVKIVNEMTLNELVKLTTLWTTGPCVDPHCLVRLFARYQRLCFLHMTSIGSIDIVCLFFFFFFCFFFISWVSDV